ncbi:MAG: hypothetical protein ACODAU_08020 [Myxococcota bacterium]
MRATGFVVGMLLCGATALGCGSTQERLRTAADVRRVEPMDLLPPGAFAYVRLDLERLRQSPYADRVVGWYRTFAPVVPEVDMDHPAAALIEDLVARMEVAAAAVFPPADALGPEQEALGDHEGAAVVVRGDLDLDWVADWATQLDVEVARRRYVGLEALVTPDPAGDQLLVARLDEGLLAIMAGHLDDVQLRLDAIRRRLESGAAGLASDRLADADREVGLRDAPLGVGVVLIPEVREELGRALSDEEVMRSGTVDAARVLALRMDADDGLWLRSMLRMSHGDAATTVAARIRDQVTEHADNPFVLLLGFDLWLERSETRADGPGVRSDVRLSDADLKTWFFHVEHLAAAAKAFFTQGGLGGLFSGFGGMGPPPEPARAEVAEPQAEPDGDGDRDGDGDGDRDGDRRRGRDGRGTETAPVPPSP